MCYIKFFTVCLSVVLYVEKGDYRENYIVVFVVINSVLFNFLCVWI